MLSDLEIAQAAKLKPIYEVAETMGIPADLIEPYGKYMAKISLDAVELFKDRPNGKYIDVTAITPTPLGEGKTVNTIGLSLGLNRIGKKVVTTIRQPSLGPVFGIKGGAAGGGYSQVVPMENFNLHLTGDAHAVGLAHNLLAAFLDNSILKGNPLGIDIHSVSWRRVVDVNDRALRKIIIGLGGKDNGVPRESGFDITAASEIMAILALTKGLSDLRARLGRVVVASDLKGKYITAEDLKCAGAMAALLKEAIKPNLLQTLEHTPCLVHSGPFGNIAHGNSSILADAIALKCADFAVTESGFGADLGAEKFINIKCRYSGLKPDAVLMVCTIRALKMHSGKYRIVPGKKLDEALLKENLKDVEAGSGNLIKQIENIKIHGLPVVVAINRFNADTDREIELVREVAIDAGAEDCVVSEVWAKGGEGGIDMARAIVKASEKPSNFRFLYPDNLSIKEKIETIATKIYGAEGVDYLPVAERQIKEFSDAGYTKLPICMAKTHLSLSHDPNVKGRPKGFRVPVREIRLSAGAGFLYPLLGEMMTMPGLPTTPAGTFVDMDETGKITGLF